MIKKITFLILLLSFSSALAGKPDSSGEIKDHLKKVKSSIEITKDKIRTTREVGYIPDLQFTLAELMLEKAKLMYSLKKEGHTDTTDIDFSAEKRALLEGVDQLMLVEERYPNYKSLDKVLLTTGLELRKVGEMDRALQVLKRLVEKYQYSEWTMRGYLEIGNIFFEKKDYEFALGQYQKVLKEKANESTAAAAYKAGWCEINLEHFLPALLHFDRLITSSTEAIQDVNSDTKKSDLREEALIASVWPYSELSENDLKENPRFLHPIEYYQSISGDKILFRRTLRRLAQRLELKNRFREAADANQTALLIDSDLAESLETMEALFTERRKAKLDAISAPVLQKISEILWLLSDKRRSSDLAKYEGLFRDILTRAHKEALQVKRVEDLITVANGYAEYAQLYPQSKYLAAMTLNEAEAAFLGKEYVRAAKIYSRTAKILSKKNSGKIKELLDSAAQSYNQALENADELSLLDKTQARNGFRDLVKTYVAQFPQDPNLAALRYNFGKSLYDEQRYTEAANAFRTYLKLHPRAPLSKQAAILLMDCFYLKDDIKGLVAEGRLLQKSNLDNDTKTKIASVMEQAQLKQVQSVAGEFATRKYADKFLEIAKRSKGSPLNESSLFEAFLSLKAGGDEKFFEVGEQYISAHQDNPKAKDVLNQMIKTALITVDLTRAAEYMRAYAHKFTNDPASASYRSQSLTLLEQTGQASDAIESLLAEKNTAHAAQLAADYGKWSQLLQISAGIPGGQGLYFQGLALIRQGRADQGLALIQRCFSEKANNPASKEQLAHAGIILAEKQVQDLVACEKETFSLATLQKMAAISKNANQYTQEVLQQESGRWSVAALAVMGRVNFEFARILNKANPPAGIGAPVFRKMIDPKVAEYKKTSIDASQKCISLATTELIPSKYTKMCQSGNKILVVESQELAVRPEGGKQAVFLSHEVRQALLKNPRAMDTLRGAYLANQKQGNAYGAYALGSRMTEIEPDSAEAWTDLGTASAQVGLREQAASFFKTALKKNPNQSVASHSLTQLLGKSEGKRTSP
jgi:tetratricopeptide (TPR) repeat protein